MSMRTLFTVNAIIQLLFGLGFLLTPAIVIGMFGAQTDATGLTLAQVAGGLILSLAIISWLGKDVEPGVAQDAMVWGFIVAHAQAGILTVASILSGTFNALAWSVVLIDAVLVVAFLWVRYVRAR